MLYETYLQQMKAFPEQAARSSINLSDFSSVSVGVSLPVCVSVCETVCTDCLLFWLYDTIPFSPRVVLTNCANYCVKFALEVKNHFDMDYIYFFLHSSLPLSISLSVTHWLSAFVCRCTHPLQVTMTINVSSSPRATKHHLTIENRVSTVWAA